MHVVVIGAGIVGAATAVELLRDGHRVTIVEPGDPGGEQAASYGNGCWLSPSSVLPVSAPGLWKKLPRWLADPLGPLAVRWSYLPKAAPWLLRFLGAGSSMAKVRKLATALQPLVHRAPDLHKQLAEEAGVGELIHKTGLLYIFPTRADYEAQAESWQVRRDNGIRWIELNQDELRQREPSLDRRYTFGLFIEEGGHCTDPGGYVAALVRHAQAQGADLIRAKALGFDIAGGRLRAVRSSAGAIACDKAVIAAGAWSRDLARQVGDRVQLETERGYHAMITNPESFPRYPIMPSDGMMANTMTVHGLRVAGQVEIAGLDAVPNWKRAEILRDYALRTYPGLPRNLPPERVKVWMGHRPSTPDSLPCIGAASGCADVVHCYGHGHIGLAAGALSGRLAADLVGCRTPVIDPAPYNPARFN
ncbi:NAD(P)/FAD-dependent oxidoreductase [Limobrevibacterium gyesilva]|uniref:FAD-binding oxidoreductase n=1 Tax=Limobrevibacterium gyesilva TaxID=2991712 RepID=A0AA42CEN9_9PROT|nr:FAD-binding oxidoreductase [Limobrevibacterium gyesilva]MCW3473776.1 FAD-binding oxidoreductase [Limobrevibacterium gyesilva]